jgi:hypothetical protein
MNRSEDGEAIKKIVGKKKCLDIWNKLYRLNRFMAKFPRPRSPDNGHAIRKVVGKPRAD